MADEEKNETTEEKAPEAEAPEAPAEDAPTADQGGEPEATPDTAEAEAEDVPADAEEPEASPDTPAGEAEDVPDEFEGMDWKARRRIERSRESGEAGPERSPEDRAGERSQRRSAAVKSRSSYRRKARQEHQGGEGTSPSERHSAPRKERQGRVTSDKSDKTITVRIDTLRRHPAYEKIVRESSTLRAHDESNQAGEGDLVRIVETRPLSRTKRWRLIEILEKAK